MTMQVLQNKFQITSARQALVRRGVSFAESSFRALIRRLGFVRGIALGDTVKSWDVLSTLNFIDQHLQNNEPILDIGCYASEVVVALHKLGYSNLTGVDLNSNIQRMPHQDSIRYEVANFMQTKFEDASFQAITSISVIEHGFQGQSLLREMSRLLRPGGYFIASFDYWPERIDTTGIKFFGMEWKIFSKEDVTEFISEAEGYRLFPVGEVTYGVKDKVIDCGGKQYTFGWLVLTKAT
jgi:SAM-dependent methyltransferase